MAKPAIELPSFHSLVARGFVVAVFVVVVTFVRNVVAFRDDCCHSMRSRQHFVEAFVARVGVAGTLAIVVPSQVTLD